MYKLDKPLYIIQSNKKNDLYLSFTNKRYFYTNKIEIAQNVRDLAFHFTSKEEATRFLLCYFNIMKDNIKEQNKKYYQVVEIHYITTPIDINIFMFNVPCYFSKVKFIEWKNNPDKFKINF